MARCFAVEYDHIRQILGPEAPQIMEMLIISDSIPLTTNLVDLHREGVCIADANEDTLKFSSEIMRVFYRDLHYKAIYGVSAANVITNWTNQTVDSLLKMVLQLFNPQVLMNTMSTSRDGRRYERIYQDEFYRCFYMLAPSKLHPDVGSLFRTKGFLDFYFDEQMWGFELLRNGDRVQEHIERFDPLRGRYRHIPVVDYAIVDFYDFSPKDNDNQQALVGKYYKVVFENDFKKILLYNSGNCNVIDVSQQ